MKPDAQFIIIKDIPLRGGDVIKRGTDVYRIHGNYYMDGGLLPESYQEDFDSLIEHENKRGWKYIQPIKTTIGKMEV